MDVKSPGKSALPEEEFANLAIEILDKDAILLVLEKMTPVSVLSFCQTNKRFAKVCSSQETFRRLMEVHYPEIPVNQNPKAQYMEITAVRGTRYALKITKKFEHGFPIETEQEAHVYEGPIKSGLITFNISGTRVRSGEMFWLYVIYDQKRNISSQTQVFKTEEEALEIFYQKTNSVSNAMILDIRKIFSKEYEKGVVMSEWLLKNDYTYPQSKEGMNNWMREMKFHKVGSYRNYIEGRNLYILILPFIIG
jgi:hypothetical protein